MRRTNKQLRPVANSLAASTKRTDTSGNPSESYDWSHMATVLREWQHEFWCPMIIPLEKTLDDRVGIEARVRKELYP
jgi:hypothetical protein